MGRGQFIAVCGLIIGLSAPLGCVHESLEPYYVDLPETDQSFHRPGTIGEMLAGKRLKKAKLKGANFQGAMLAGTDLREADLENADLTHAMLLGADLSRANLVNANFEAAMLLGTHLENAHIDGANFTNTSWLTQDQLDDACGTPKGLPEGLKAPKTVTCEQSP